MNELQQVLNDIKQDKNTNLLPGNLRDNVTCLGIEGTAKVPIPIYATTDYTIKNASVSVLNTGDKLYNNVSIKDGYCLVSSYDRNNFDIYRITETSMELLSTPTVSFSGYGTACIIKKIDNLLYIMRVATGKQIVLYTFNVDTLELFSIKVKSSGRDNTKIMNYYDTDYVIVFNDANDDDEGVIYKLSDDNTDVVGITSTPGVYFSLTRRAINKPLAPNIFGAWYSPESSSYQYMYLAKCDIESNSWNQQLKYFNTDGHIVGVSYDGTKAFILNKGIYTLNSDLSIGEKLADFTINMTANRMLSAINDRYYILCDYSYINKYGDVDGDLYEFDNETNTFTYINSLSDMIYHPGHLAKIDTSTRIADVYDFVQGTTQIGISMDGKNYYYTDNNPVTSDKILAGYETYTKGYQPIIGTMPNNGELNITPTTENQNIPEGYTSGGTVLGDENLKSENIKKNVSIFGVTGSLESSSGQMKLFKTQEEMQADPDAKEGDLAVVYDDSPMKMEAGVYYNGSLTMYFPKVVTLDEAVSSAISNKQWTMLDYNDVGYSLTSSSFEFGTYDYMEDDITGEYATYTSSDGITYTRTTDKDSITFELEYHVVLSTSHSIVGNFLLLENGVFRGLYKYDTKLNELKSKGYINPVVTDEVLSYDKLSSVNINTILPCLKTIYNNDNKSYGRYIVVIKNNGDIFAYDYKDGNSSTDYWTFPGIICDGNKIYISQNYTSSTTHIFRKHKLNTEDGTVESETLSNLSTYQYQTVSDELNKDDIITILTNDGVSSTITVDFFGENSGTDNLNTNKVDLKMAYAEESKYYSAKTQFTIEKPNELLPGLIAYGKSGDVTGDGTIYNNLDCREILKKLYGENNLIYSTDSSKTYACSKDVNNNQIMLSGEVDKLTQFIKLSENIESSTKTAIVRNTSTENYITYDGTCEITINKSSGKLLVKNMNTEEEHIHSFVSNPYSVDIRILPNDILLIVQQDNDIPTAIVYKIDLTTQSMTSMTLDCNVSYSSSYKDLEFANVDAINKKLYFTSNVQTASTSMKFKFGYINLTNMSAVLLVDKSVTFSSSYPHSQELSTIFTQNGNVVVYMGRYYNSKDYASMTIYSRENDSIVLNVSEKQVNTANFSNLFKTYCNVVAYDDGTTLYWGSNRLNKSSLEYSFDGTDYTVPYFMDYSGKYAFSYFTGDSIIIFDLEKNTNLSIPFPNVSVAIVDDKYNHSAAGFNCAPIIKDDKLQVLFTDHYFISPIYNVEEASILDYEYMLVCSVTSTNAFYPQYSYSKINSGTISSEEYNTALNTAKQIEGSAE